MWNLDFFPVPSAWATLQTISSVGIPTSSGIPWNSRKFLAGVLYQLQVFNVTLLLLRGFFNMTKFLLQRSDIALNGMAPSYICDLLQVHQPNQNLRSAFRGLSLVVPPHQTQAYGARSFSVAAPTLWNSLPVDIKNVQSLFIFKKKLKTFLFNQPHS